MIDCRIMTAGYGFALTSDQIVDSPWYYSLGSMDFAVNCADIVDDDGYDDVMLGEPEYMYMSTGTDGGVVYCHS